MKQKSSLLVSVVLGSFILFSPPTVSQAADQYRLQATAGGVGGVWYSTMASLVEVVMKANPDFQIKVVPGGGVGNPLKIAQGTSDLGWSYPAFAKIAHDGGELYGNKRYEDLRGIANGFSAGAFEFTVLESSGISSLDEIFKNKMPITWLTGTKTSSTGFFFDMLAKYYGYTTKDIESWGGKVIYAAYGDWEQMAKDGHVSAMFNHIAPPSPQVQEIVISRKLKVLPLPEGLRKYFVEQFSCEETVIPAGTYAFLKDDVRTVEMASAIYVNKKVPEEAVYQFLMAIDKHIDEVKNIHPTWESFKIETSHKSLGAPLHAGAERFYKERHYK